MFDTLNMQLGNSAAHSSRHLSLPKYRKNLLSPTVELYPSTDGSDDKSAQVKRK
jgi:hypothetical protein